MENARLLMSFKKIYSIYWQLLFAHKCKKLIIYRLFLIYHVTCPLRYDKCQRVNEANLKTHFCLNIFILSSSVNRIIFIIC